MIRVIVSTLSPLDDDRWSYLVEVTESDGKYQDSNQILLGRPDAEY